MVIYGIIWCFAVYGILVMIQEITRENQARIDHSFHEIEMLKNIYELRNTINQ